VAVEERRGGDDADLRRARGRLGESQRGRHGATSWRVRSAPARLAARARYFSI
jgi:hypothetical protein